MVFTCNSCPVAADYEDRIAALEARKAELRAQQTATETKGAPKQGATETQTAPTPQQIVETTLRWQAAGGTGVSVLTQKAGLATIDEHADFLHRVMAALGSAGTR